MSVATHLSIRVDEYDSRIRTFVPGYEHLIATAAETLGLLDASSPVIIDLGAGTGALSARCLDLLPNAELIAVDSDPAMIEVARVRLQHHPRVSFLAGNFLELVLPPCDAIVACIALHHVSSAQAKRDLYAACHLALRPGGLLVSADCFPARDARLAERQHRQWLAHLQQVYTAADAEAYLTSWALEDTYFPLEDELEWLSGAGFQPDVISREGGFAVIAGRRRAN
ncbi:MAG: class I SAM-dependent methyltransferase [Gemmatimonadota bacterium]